MSRKYYTRIASQHDIEYHGRHLPLNCVYGRCKTSCGVTSWYIDDLNYYPDGVSIDVHILDNKTGRWIEKRICRGQIHRDFESMVNSGRVKLGTECVNPLMHKGTFTDRVTTKRKSSGFKQANDTYWKRGERGSRWDWELQEKTGLITENDTVYSGLETRPAQTPQTRNYLNSNAHYCEWVNGEMYVK